MSLSKQIIYGTDREIARILQSGVELNVVDEYGYTPLIQTAIVNSSSKAKLLLETGAQVDFPDLTNRTALHWAASNGNYDLVDLLLQHSANPNAYTNAGQSVLVTPLLKKNEAIKKLLLKSGANLSFAQDFINGKLLGHRFELEGRVDIVDHAKTFIEIELEGFYLEFSLEIVASSLIDFKNNFGGKHLRKYFPLLEKVISSLQAAVDLIKYQNYLVDINEHRERIEELLQHEPLILPISFGGHAISFIRFQDTFVRCDRGAFGVENGTVIFYNLGNKSIFNRAFCKQLLYKRQHDKFINQGLERYLSLEEKDQLPLAPQKTGNCSWANVEAVVPSLMFLLMDEKNYGKNREKTKEEALNFYHEWVEWDRNRALHFCLEGFEETDEARKVSKAALLAAILFQHCRYETPEDYTKAQKIINILQNEKYVEILKIYFKVFSQDPKNPYLKNLLQFLNIFGINLDKL